MFRSDKMCLFFNSSTEFGDLQVASITKHALKEQVYCFCPGFGSSSTDQEAFLYDFGELYCQYNEIVNPYGRVPFTEKVLNPYFI